ncbi:MAG: hypothetical protein DGJ47_001018 [Rickettsiaceae bacterium]
MQPVERLQQKNTTRNSLYAIYIEIFFGKESNMEEQTSIEEEAPQPVKEAPQVVEEAPQPVEEAPQPVKEAPQAVEEAPQPVEEAPQPVKEAPQAVEEAPQPVEEAPQPVEEAPQPVEEATQPLEEEAPQPIEEAAPQPVALPKPAELPKPEAVPPQPVEEVPQLEQKNITIAKSIKQFCENISDISGTAVNIQSMVFGNKNDNSATGVVFTRNPSDGKKSIFGEYLINAQGEDVVAGIRTPFPIESTDNAQSMQNLMPKQYNSLAKLCDNLEKHFSDMQDIEFTVEDGELFLLQTRSGKRSAAAAVQIAVDMVSEGIISKQNAIMSIDPESLNQLLHTTIDYTSNPQKIAKGLPASPGAGMGIAVFSPTQAEEMSVHHKVILVRNDTSPEDIKGMHVAQGIITARGGMTSHAAVVARGLGTPCVCGVNNIKVNENDQLFTTQDGLVIKQGDLITIDGSSGNIIKGQASLVEPNFSDAFKTILKWSDQEKRLKIRSNSETILDTNVALKFGADGIGLCRTEHMFFDDNKIPLIRQMIISPNNEKRQDAINKLRPMQAKDFRSLFKIMDGLPVNIRLLDPPLHEFLPASDDDKKSLAESLEISFGAVESRLQELHETNPMLGHRGCRLGVSHPEIYKMQIEAILDAIIEIKKESGQESYLELMIPLVSEVKELIFIKKYIQDIIAYKEQETGISFNIKLGTMIELPRSAILSDQIAQHVDYFSFGSNDLTQTTYGISRDDIGSFLPSYLEKGIFQNDPFAILDEEGVGELIKISSKKGRQANQKISLGVCGEHAGNPESIKFFDKVGLDYISCSPYRIPIARVAAAQSYIANQKGNK